jgi:MFS family permease
VGDRTGGPTPFLLRWRQTDARALSLNTFFYAFGLLGEQVLLGWLTLELTDSAFVVGIAMAMQMLPLLLLGIPAGVLADRVDRIRLLQGSGLALGTAAAALGAIVALGSVALWQLLACAFASGCARALQAAARQSYAHDVGGAAGLVDVLALVGLTSRVGGLLGSLVVGGLLARWGPAVAYLVTAASYCATAAVMAPARREVGHRAPGAPRSVRADLAAFLSTVRRHRTLLSVMALTAGAEILGFSHQTLLPSLARDVLHVGAGGLGVMTGARQLGGVIGTIFAAALGRAYGHGLVFVAVLAGFGASLVALGLAPTFGAAVAVLVVANALGAVSDVLGQALIQLSVPAALRGRAGGAWVLAIGLAPLGQLQLGALASLAGVSAAFGASGLGLIAITAVIAALSPRLRKP